MTSNQNSHELPEAVRAEIERRRFAPGERVGQWMIDMEAIARLAMRETARECAEIARTWGNAPPRTGGRRDALAKAIRARFGLEER